MNKPRVFLSHSKKNSIFIEKLADDLRRCQIEPWIDTLEIRHGKSWQDSIFQYGLPTCDAVIVYFTELSLQSQVVKKEMDVALLQNLKDSNVAFLPYVDNEELRGSLRPDIQALQTPEWNEKNYYQLLPRVVAEIWRSYLERIVSSAIRDERIKRMEAERELEKYRNQPNEVFSKSESQEFEFIWNSFNKVIQTQISYSIYGYDESITGRPQLRVTEGATFIFSLNLSTVVALLSNYFGQEYKRTTLIKELVSEMLEAAGIIDQDKLSLNLDEFINFHGFTDELLTQGLVENFTYTKREYESERLEHKSIFTKKYFRFRYWLAFHKNLPEKILFNLLEKKEGNFDS